MPIFLSNPPPVGWKNSNPPPTHQSLTPIDWLQILVVSTQRVMRIRQVGINNVFFFFNYHKLQFVIDNLKI